MNNSATKNSFGKTLSNLFFSKSWVSGLIPLVLILLLCVIFAPKFFSVDNFADLLRTASYSLVIAAPFTFLMTTGQLDLSMGAMISFGGVVCGKAMAVYHMPIIVAMIVTLIVCGIVGLFKAFIILKFNLPPFIITLGLQYMINGIILVWTKGITVTQIPAAFKVLGQGTLFPNGFRIYYTVLMAAVIAIFFYILLEKTKFGRCVSAVGGNRETARIAGIRVNFYLYACHMIVSMACSLAGMLYCSRFSSALTTVGTGMELNIIAGTVIGGTSMFGGNGTIIGTVIGTVLFAVITNALIMMGVSVYWQNFVFGLILIVSIMLDRYRRNAATGSAG